MKRLRLVILDACRDNPFARSMRRTIATRSVRSGYGEIDERSLPPNTLVAYAQRAGSTAEDGFGSDSPYTLALLKHLTTPGLDVELALRRVRDEVLRATKNRQEPFKYGSLGGAELPLVSASAGTAELAAKQVETGAKQLSEAAEAWDRTKDTANVAVLEAFAARYTATFYAELARARVEELKKQQIAAIGTVGKDTPTTLVKECSSSAYVPDLPSDHPLQEFFKNLPPDLRVDRCRVSMLGLTIGPGKEGASVIEVAGDSDARNKGLKQGDTILEVGATPTQNTEAVAKAVMEASKLGRKAVLMRVKSGDQTRFVAIALQSKK